MSIRMSPGFGVKDPISGHSRRAAEQLEMATISQGETAM
jgi:hypothetical protein